MLSVSGSYRDDLAQCTILVQFCHVGWPFEQRDDWFVSPRALYEEGVVHPLVFAILPPS